MATWIKPVNNDIRCGDIVETVSKIPPHIPVGAGLKLPFIKHYGMVTTRNGKKYIVHNIIGRSPTIAPFDEVFSDRNINRIYRTGMTNSEIMAKYNECKDESYKPFRFNCESLMNRLSGTTIRFPQTYNILAIISILGVIILIIFLIRKK